MTIQPFTASRTPRVALVAACLLAFAAAVSGAKAQGFTAFGGFQHDSTQPVAVEADNFQIENAANKGVLTGKVRVAQGTIQMRSDRLEIYYSGKGGANKAAATGSVFGGGGSAVERLIARGKVRIRDGQGRMARANMANYNVAKREIVLTGNVAVLDDSDGASNLLQGDKLKIDLFTGRAEVINQPGARSGRVRMTLSPGKKN